MFSSQLWMFLSIMYFTAKGELDSAGQEFVFTMPISYLRSGAGGSPYIYITPSSQESCHATIEVPSIRHYIESVVSPRGIQVSLPRNVFPILGEELTPTIIVRTTCPVSVNGYFQLGVQHAESFTVLPTDALDNEYMLIGYPLLYPAPVFPDFFSITAVSEFTSAHIELKTGDEFDITLQPYESFLFEHAGKGAELTGSIRANESVAVIAGMTCTFVPASSNAICGSMIDQMIPIPAQQFAPFEYILAPFLTRQSGYVFRIIGTVDNASVVINHGEPIHLGDAGTPYTSDDTIVITSDSPVYIAQFMKNFDSDQVGGISFVIVPPVSSSVNSVNFYAFDGGSTNINCYVNVIVKCDDIGDLLLDVTTRALQWDTLYTEDRSMCALRSGVDVGAHRITAINNNVTFLVYVYGIPAENVYSYLHLGRFNVLKGEPITTTTTTTTTLATTTSSTYTTDLLTSTDLVPSDLLTSNDLVTSGLLTTTDLLTTDLLTSTDLLTTSLKDTEPPTLYCPDVKEHYVTTATPVINVTWPDPIYKDNSGILGGMNSTHHPPTQFPVGSHRAVYNAWDSHGNVATCVVTIQVTAACPGIFTNVTNNVDSEMLSWPLIPAGNEEVPSKERCDVSTEKRGYGLGYRVCAPDDELVATWLPVNIATCGSDDEVDLQELSETEVVESNVRSVAEALYDVTENKEEYTTKEVEDVAECIRNIADVETVTPEVITDVVGIVNNVVVNTSPDDDEETKEPHLDNILMAFEEQVTRVADTAQTFDPIIESNIALTSTIKEQSEESVGLNFAVIDDGELSGSFMFTEDSIKIYEDESEILDIDLRSSISLPASIFSGNDNDTVGVNFVAYNTDALFQSSIENKTVGGDIIAAIIGSSINVTKLEEPVVLEFKVTGDNPVCVFWDFHTSDWSQAGCFLVNDSDNKAVCHCYHLTNFAVLVDLTYTETHFILDLISKIGCGLSICALLITITIFVCFRRLRTGPNATPRIIHIHLCISLLILYITFLVGIDMVSHRLTCLSIAAALQCFTLVSLSWMSVEAYNLYLNIVRMFDAEPDNFVKKAFVVAWGVPLIITGVSVGLSLGFNWPYYDHLEYCFVSIGPVFYFGLVLPIGLLLMYNTVTFVWVMDNLCKANLGGNVTQQSKIHKIAKRFWHALTISILMGLTWVFGLLAIIEGTKFVFSVIFCACNSLQGVAIFVLFCLRQDDVRKTVFPFCSKTQGTTSAHRETHSTHFTTVNQVRDSGHFTAVIPTTEYNIGHGGEGPCTTEHNIGHARGGSYTNFSGGFQEYELSAVDNDHCHQDEAPQTDPASPLLAEQAESSSLQKSSSTSSKKSKKNVDPSI